MTTEFINYQRQQEDARHNRETEAQGRTGLAETRRRNSIALADTVLKPISAFLN